MIDHALYRFFDATGQLLYVGLTSDPGRRMGQHRVEKPWWSEVANVTIQTYPDRESVAAAERAAIRTETPRYNVACTMRPRERTAKGPARESNISVRLPAGLVSRLDAQAKTERRSRSTMLMLLLEEALDAS